MLQVANKRYPDFYLLPVYVCWGLSALMLAAVLVVPESPWYHARHGQKEAAFKSMKRLYGNVNGYDYEEVRACRLKTYDALIWRQEYGIIQRTLEHEKMELETSGTTRYKDIFSGRNKQRTMIITVFFTAELLGGLAMISTYSTCEFVRMRVLYDALILVHLKTSLRLRV